MSMFNLHGSVVEYRSDQSVWGHAVSTVGFGDRPDLYWVSNGGYDHHHREPYHSSPQYQMPRSAGGLMHLQFVSRRRLVAKHALYKMNERIRWPDKRVADIDRMYSMAPDTSVVGLSVAPSEWWGGYHGIMPYLKVDAEPWQEQECERLMDVYGRKMFTGLDLFGVVQ
jgi:hypothetical protein